MKISEDLFSWSNFYAFRREIRKRYPSVYSLKIKKKIFNIISEEIGENYRILDVGASGKILREKILQQFPSAIYKSMDIDTCGQHDYYSLDAISESFDLIILSEVIEHIEFNNGLILLRRLWDLLNDSGRIIVSTPNLHHPNRYWQDPDHKTPYHYDVIGGSLLSVGFKIDSMHRIYNDQFMKRFFRMYLASCVHKYLDIDFAESIVVTAKKK
jgi:2-polyprenyl-3-methyl-5-hydroxy-6-metoxy-1,4-benzoquinol methylase